jgi:hypothetical protein
VTRRRRRVGKAHTHTGSLFSFPFRFRFTALHSTVAVLTLAFYPSNVAIFPSLARRRALEYHE